MERPLIQPGKTAVVGGGGGFFGAFQVGCLKIIEKYKIPIDEGVCVSVGAIDVASFFADNCSAKNLEKIYRSLTPSQVFERESISHILWTRGKIEAFYKMEPLIKLVGDNLNARKLIEQPKEFIATATHVPSGKVAYFSNKDPEIIADPLKMLLAIIASCAIPTAFRSVHIRYKGSYQEYIDGAFRRPLPILKAIRDGCNTIIVLRCHSDKIVRPMPRWAPQRVVWSLSLTTNGVEKDEIALMKKEQAVNLFVLEPEQLPSTLNTVSFAKGDIEKAIAEGERIALRELAPLIEYYQSRSVATGEEKPPALPGPEQT